MALRIVVHKEDEVAKMKLELRGVTRKNRELEKSNKTLRSRLKMVLGIAKSWRTYAGSDPMLTELGNKKALGMQMGKEIGRAIRHEEVLSVMMLDLDFLKKVNDSEGHDAGDRMLKAVQRAILDTIRREEFAARVGGDEFVILMPGTGLNGAETVEKRIRGRLSQKGISISIGIAVMNAKEHDSKDSSAIDKIGARLLELADIRMYEEKVGKKAERK